MRIYGGERVQMKREKIKALIELSANVEEADEIIVSLGFETTKEKIAYLSGMFDFQLIGRYTKKNITKEKEEEMDYFSILNTIISEKWEA